MNEIYVVGIGPGNYEDMTVRAVKTLEKCDVIVGYTVYADIIKPYFPEKEYFSTAMKKEKDRCIEALKLASQGKKTAVICSGDASVYAMASLIYELSIEFDGINITVVPGITAAISGSAVLGAAVSHDFAVISLSDLLTPWGEIEKRLRCAAEGDFVICIYNPSSKKRYDYLQKACDIMLKYKKEDTICAVVRNIGRDGESKKILSLKELRGYEADMFTTVFVGNRATKVINGAMVTPRGYVL